MSSGYGLGYKLLLFAFDSFIINSISFRFDLFSFSNFAYSTFKSLYSLLRLCNSCFNFTNSSLYLSTSI